MDSNSADSETFYCSFVSNEYIICECGDNLATEDALKVHLDNNHDVSEKEVIQEEPKLPKTTKIVYIVKKNQIKKFETVVFELPTEEHSSTEEVEVKEELKQELYELPATEPDSAPASPATPDPEETSLQEDAPEATTAAYPNLVNLEHNYDKDNAPAEFFCDFCGKSFASQRSVSIHMTRVHRPPFQKDVRTDGQASLGRKAVCEQCGKKYPSNAALRYHQRTHTGEKPYECSVCPKKFTMPLFLQLHLRTHTGERPYECALCPKAFSCQAAIQRHLRVHTGEKPYECAECGKAFSQSNSRKLHVHTVHRKLPTPYKSRARRNKATRKAAEAVVGDDVMTLHYDDDVNVKAEEFTTQECELVYDNDVYDE